MTVSYNLDVSSSNTWNFLKIVFRWRGSIWKNVAGELIVWTFCYMIISVIYRFALDKEHQSTFAKVAAYIDENMDYIPLTFLLGFFVSVIFGRWKDIFSHIGFIDRAAFFVTNYIHANDEEEFIVIKRNILRYLCLTQVMVLRDISVPVRKRFPNMQSVMDAGFLLPNELKSMEKVITEYPKYWMPINWAISLAIKCRKEGKILADVFLNTTCVEIASFQEHLRILLNYDWVPVPLAYPQVVFLAVRVYFILTLISRQYIIAEDDPHYSKIDLIVPFMSMLQLIFQMSWLKVAEALLNPFGEDDDDFECNYIIDRNISIALTMVGQTFDDVPEQFRDKFDKEEKPLYSEETAKLGTRALIGSVARVAMENEEEKVKMIPREPIEEPARKRAETRSQSIDLTGLTNRLSIKHLKSRLQQNRSQSLSLESGQKGPLASPNLKNWRQNPDLPLETPKSPTSPTIHYLEEIAEENPAFDFYDENFEEKKP